MSGSEYLTPEQEEAKKKREEEYARYNAQVGISGALTQLITSKKNDASMAEEVLNWVQSDKWRDAAISGLKETMKSLEEQGKRIESMFNVELRKMRSSLSSHIYDDFDWIAEYNRVKNAVYDLYDKVETLEKENKLLTTKMMIMELRDIPSGPPLTPEKYKELKASIDDEALMEKVAKGHVLMEWEAARFMEINQAKREKGDD